MTELGSTIHDYLTDHYTYDLAELRYLKKDIFVFIYDDMKHEDQLRTYLPGARKNIDYKIVSYSAVTEGKFLPWYEISTEGKSYTSYCLDEADDLALIETPDYARQEPLPIKGVLLKLTLETLQDFDWYYENEDIFERSTIKVNQFINSAQPVIVDAYCYMNTFDTMADEVQGKLKLKGEFDLCPFNTVKANGLEVYEF